MDVVDLLAKASVAFPDFRGKSRLSRLLLQRSSMTGTFRTTMKAGHVMVSPRASRQGWAAAFTGRYDDATIALLAEQVEEGSAVLDIGASLGFWTVPLARQSGAAVVHAFEPIAANRAYLQRNVKLNDLQDRVVVHDVGLGAAAAELPAVLEAGGVGNAGIVPSREEHQERWETMPIVIKVERLDDVLKLDRRCSAIKIDVEGFEMDVLAGATAFIAEHRPVILGEFSVNWWADRGVPANAAGVWATEHHYDLFEVRLQPQSRYRWDDRVALDRLPEGGTRRGGNILLVPRLR